MPNGRQDSDQIIKALLEDLNNIKISLDTVYGKRLLVLYLDMYLDYFVTRLYDKKLILLKEEGIDIDSIKHHDDEKIRNLSLKGKITHLVIWGIVEKRYFKGISLIHKVRNKMAHYLDFDLSELEEEMKEIIDQEKPEEDRLGLIQKYLDSSSLWEKFIPFTYTLIFHLYEYLHEIDKTHRKYSIRLLITPDASSVKPILTEIPLNSL